ICKTVHLLKEDPHKAARQWWDTFSIDLQQWMLACSGGRFKGTSMGNVVSLAKKHGLNPPDYTSSGASIRELYPEGKTKEIEYHLIQDLKIIRWLHLKGAREVVKLSSNKPNFFDS
ncbi:hypothetical protein KQH27_00860, partial [bacterium]|nr:hypothetical protein [bacterium]